MAYRGRRGGGQARRRESIEVVAKNEMPARRRLYFGDMRAILRLEARQVQRPIFNAEA